MDIRCFFGGKAPASATKKENVANVAIPVSASKEPLEEEEEFEPSVKVASRKSKVVDDSDEEEDKKMNIVAEEHVKETIKEVAAKSVFTKSAATASVASKPAMATAVPKGAVDVATAAVTTDSTDGEYPSELESLITWDKGQTVPYLALVDTFEKIAATSGRLEKESLLCNLFRSAILTTPAELHVLVHLASNSVASAYENVELGIGDSLLVKAICEATGRKRENVEDDYRREGDLGIVALLSRSSQKTLSFGTSTKPKASLSVVLVWDQLKKIAKTKGEKAQSRKVDLIKAMMIKCVGQEAKYLIRALQGKLRIGTANQTVLVALATAFALTVPPAVMAKQLEDKAAIRAGGSNGDEAEGDADQSDRDPANITPDNFVSLIENLVIQEPTEAVKLRTQSKLGKQERAELAVIAVKKAFSECPNLVTLTTALLNSPLYNLHKTCQLVPGIPIAPMLAKPTKEISEVLRRLNGLEFTMEYKYDGERAQVHVCSDGSVNIFSRNSEDNTQKYPDLIDIVKRAMKPGVTSCVLDGEVVAYDREKGCLLPFQVLSTRKRKVDEDDAGDQKVKIILQVFDCLYLNGKSLLYETLKFRRTIMQNCFEHIEGQFHCAIGQDHVENGDTAPIEAFMNEACVAMCEGLMVKTLTSNATYEPSKRSLNWLKLKKDYINGMGVCDSVDLVVMAGYPGKGKRTNVYGAYLMGCYDTDTDEFQSLCKVGTGFKDEDLTNFTAKMEAEGSVESRKKPYNYVTGDMLITNDIEWFRPVAVWELQAADLSLSSVHKGGIHKLAEENKAGAGERGIGLRFPRFLRERTDKKPEQATNVDQIVDMYYSQSSTGPGQGGGGGGGDFDDDEYL